MEGVHGEYHDDATQIQKIIEKSENFVFFTGAGISRESGIPTFRDKDGLWKKYDPAKLASHSAFISNPKLVWDFFYSRQRLVCQAECNDAHTAIGRFENTRPKRSHVITQNIDRLHQRGGSQNVIELHGNIFGMFCIVCGKREQYDYFNFFDNFNEEKIPICLVCNNILKPDVVLFEEQLPQDAWNQAVQLSSECDIMFVVGTSLNVSPANTLPYHAVKNHAVLVEINPHVTEMTSLMDFSIRESASKVLPRILDVD
ncbi:SIR2 family NAD-dependent protein deacylase [Candidatus Nitrosocosmicus sp. R]